MKNKMRTVFVGIITLWMVSLAHANTFTLQIIGEPPTLDWHKATDSVSADILFNIMEGLTLFNEKLEVKPGLAEKWTVSKDGTVYTFHLKKNVTWSDGAPLKAQHFVDGWLRLLDRNTAGEYAYFLFDVKNAQQFNAGTAKAADVGVKAINDHTLEITLNAPASYFLSMLTFWASFPVRLDSVAKHGDGWADAGKMITLGAYTLSEWKHDSSLVLKANPKYHAGKPSIDEIKVLIVKENSTALTLFETGKIDMMRAEIPPVDMARFKGKPELRQHPYLRGYYYGFHTQKKPMDDVRIRRAFAMAIDKTLFPKILKGEQIPAKSWIPQGMLGYDAKVGLDFDPARAKKLLAEAGFPDGKGLPPITLMYDTREENKIIAETIQSQLKQNIGVSVSVSNQEWKTYLKVLDTEETPHFWRLGWGADFPDPDNFMNLFTGYSGNNKTRWKNKDFDNLISVAAKEKNPKKRIAHYTRLQKMMLEEHVAIVPLFQQQIIQLVNTRVKQAPLNAMNILYLKDFKL